MQLTQDAIQKDTVALLQSIADDWEYSGAIGKETRFLADLGFESLDVVILSVEVERHYSQSLPFTDFFEEIGKRDIRDISIGEWSDFIFTNLKQHSEADATVQQMGVL